jgi:prepilin-type N-terminal cleavage/methylation domain-containing protein
MSNWYISVDKFLSHSNSMSLTHRIHISPRGFTLIELLVVIAIIGILASIVLASLSGARSGGKDVRRISDVKQIKYAVELYYQRLGQYPCKLYDPLSAVTCELNGSIEMPNVPKDPDGADYSYSALGTGASCTQYHLGASLEKNSNLVLRSDRDATAAGTLCTSSLANFHGWSASAGGAACSATPGSPQPSGTETCYDVNEQ